MDGLSDEERAIRYALYWYHNGTRKHSKEAFDSCTTNLPTKELVKAVLDKYNEDNGLVGVCSPTLSFFGSMIPRMSSNTCFTCWYYPFLILQDLAYELEDIVRHKACFDGKDCIYRSYAHFNLTMKTKGAANKDLYFAEVTRMDGDYEAYVLTCFCMVKPDDNGIIYLTSSALRFRILISRICFQFVAFACSRALFNKETN